jgi:hypothetical protein
MISIGPASPFLFLASRLTEVLVILAGGQGVLLPFLRCGAQAYIDVSCGPVHVVPLYTFFKGAFYGLER